MKALRSAVCCLALLLACVMPAQAATPLPLLRAQGTLWVAPGGKPVALKGVNLGN